MSIKKISFISIFTTLALIMSYIEMQIPNFIMIPGVKLGLANIVIIVVLYKYGLTESVIINSLRIVIINTIFGSIVSFIYAFVGGFFSLFVMFFFKKCNKFSYIFVSVLGGVSHNIGQIIVAVIITNTKEILYYLPVLLIFGIISGVIIGILSAVILKKLHYKFNFNN